MNTLAYPALLHRRPARRHRRPLFDQPLEAVVARLLRKLGASYGAAGQLGAHR
jgi:hypothetical protein